MIVRSREIEGISMLINWPKLSCGIECNVCLLLLEKRIKDLGEVGMGRGLAIFDCNEREIKVRGAINGRVF